MVTYKIRFDKDRKAIAENSDIEKPISFWKKQHDTTDALLIEVSGRKKYPRSYASTKGSFINPNVTYKICDELLPKKARTKELMIVILFNVDNTLLDIVTKGAYLKKGSYPGTRPISELLDAVIAADTYYAKPGGGVMYSNPFYKNEAMVEKLKHLLTEIHQHAF